MYYPLLLSPPPPPPPIRKLEHYVLITDLCNGPLQAVSHCEGVSIFFLSEYQFVIQNYNHLKHY